MVWWGTPCALINESGTRPILLMVPRRCVIAARMKTSSDFHMSKWSATKKRGSNESTDNNRRWIVKWLMRATRYRNPTKIRANDFHKNYTYRATEWPIAKSTFKIQHMPINFAKFHFYVLSMCCAPFIFVQFRFWCFPVRSHSTQSGPTIDPNKTTTRATWFPFSVFARCYFVKHCALHSLRSSMAQRWWEEYRYWSWPFPWKRHINTNALRLDIVAVVYHEHVTAIFWSRNHFFTSSSTSKCVVRLHA